MVIKRSAGQEISGLVSDLDAADDVRREAAVARLSVIGTRAVDRLVALLTRPPVSERATVSALHVLEAIDDVRALPVALSLLGSPHADISVAAVAVARRFLHSAKGEEVLDRLVALALDARQQDTTRLAALDALQDTASRVLAPLWDRLRDDPSLALQQRAARETGGADPLVEIEAAAGGVLPDEAETLTALVARVADSAPLATLHRLVEAVSARETRERSPHAKAAWLAARGAIHAALARRDSRVALYDLRDTLASATSSLPGDFLVAMAAIGDAAALEALASAYARALATAPSEWRDDLKRAFRAIAEREGVTVRHAVIKRIATKWPEAAAEMVEKGTRAKKAR